MRESVLVLVHSPLVGPSSWRPLDEVARDRGLVVVRPDLTAVADAPSPRWRRFVDLAVDAVEERSDLIVVGHSGAGAVLPAIGERVADRLRCLIFVDAVVPPARGAHTTPKRLRELLDAKTVEGRLPKWLDWWSHDVVAELVPDADDRVELYADMPQLPRSFYDEDVSVPVGWSSGSSGYLRLSSAYDEDFERAGIHGWPRASIHGTHLSIFTNPSNVLDDIESLVARLV